MKNRAIKEWQKREVLERVLEVWLKHPHQRLGQLIDNATQFQNTASIFYVEDYDLVDAVENLFKLDK